MLINLHIRNFRSIRKADISFVAERDDMSVFRKLKDGSFEHRLLRTADINAPVVPVKNIIGLPAFGKTSVIEALYTLKELADGVNCNTLYTPCLEIAEYADANTQISADFTVQHGEVRYNASYSVTYNVDHIVCEKLYVDDEFKTHYHVENLKVVDATENLLNGYLNDVDLVKRKNNFPNSSLLSALGLNAPHEILGSIKKTLVDGLSFLFLRDLSAHAVVNAFENFSQAVSPYLYKVKENKEEFLLKQLSFFMRDITNIEGLRHEINPNGSNIIWAKHKREKGKGFYEIDFKHESEGSRAAFLVLVHILKTLFTGSVAIIDDFNSFLPPYAQIYLPKIFKNERNELEAQLVIVHHGEKVMIPDGEDCADEVCCLNRSPETGTVAVSGRELLKSRKVEFSKTLTKKVMSSNIDLLKEESEDIRPVTPSKRKRKNTDEPKASKKETATKKKTRKSDSKSSEFYFESAEEN